MTARPPIVAVVGATATGKTAFAEVLAARLDAEIVCADSRQVFAALEIGTGKPEPSRRALRPHHLFDALALGQRASAGWYARAAREVVAAVRARGRVPLLVGGSGLYLRAAREGLSAEPPHDPAVRERLRLRLATEGVESLHAALARVDRVSAARLRPRDAQRVTRALEVWEASGRPLSWWHAVPGTRGIAGPWRLIELTAAPSALEAVIVARTRAMFAAGLIEETRDLLAHGDGDALRTLRAVGYDEAIAVLDGTLDRAAAEERTSLRTRQLAKRQRTWFRHQVDATRIDVAESGLDAALDRALQAIRTGRSSGTRGARG
jgi:tRNA dimethylallyltransferase